MESEAGEHQDVYQILGGSYTVHGWQRHFGYFPLEIFHWENNIQTRIQSLLPEYRSCWLPLFKTPIDKYSRTSGRQCLEKMRRWLRTENGVNGQE